LLSAAWVCIDESFAPIILLLALAAAATTRQVTDERRGRLMLFGAGAIMCLAILVFIGSVLDVSRKMALVPANPLLYSTAFLLDLRQLRPWASGGVLPASVLCLVWWLGERRNPSSGAAALVAAAALCAAFTPLGWSAWSRTMYTQKALADFADWRRQIPPQAEVLWPGSVVGPWYVLGRSSYWSLEQMAGIVFSRATAMELESREYRLTHVPVELTPVQQLTETCRTNPALGFVVTAKDLGPTPFAPVVLDSTQASGRLLLYRCADYGVSHRG
jgi:hypothetical protein